MKTHLIAARAAGLVFACALTQVAMAATYYVSNGGYDTWGGSQLFPVATLSKANSLATQPGDTIKLRCGSVWRETLIPKSGVIYSSYPDAFGNCAAKPVISGAADLSKATWTVDSGAIYKTNIRSLVGTQTNAAGALIPAGVNQLFIDGKRMQRARFPNAGQGDFGLGLNRYIKAGQNTPTVNIDNGEIPKIEVANRPAGKAAVNPDLIGAEVYSRNYPWFLAHYTVTNYQTVTNTDGTTSNMMSLAPAKSLSSFDVRAPGDTSNDPSKVMREDPATFSPSAGVGYWLENKRWMLDQPNEWFYDSASGDLYVYLPDGSNPTGRKLTASVRAHAVDAHNAAFVSLNNIEVRETRGDAIWINLALQGVNVKSVDVISAGARGITTRYSNGNASSVGGYGNIDGVTVSGSVEDAIDLGANSTYNLGVINSTLTDTGLGYFAWHGIRASDGGTVRNNTVKNSTYIGIHGAKNNLIDSNVVVNSCLQFDDCGAIYTIGRIYGDINKANPDASAIPDFNLNISIINNLLVGIASSQAPDRLDGLSTPDGSPLNLGSSVNGVYLDDYSASVFVDSNYVSGHDYGVVVHLGRDNKIWSNQIVGSERYAVLMDENKMGDRQYLPCGTSCTSWETNNYVRANTIAGTSATALVRLNSDFGSTSDFGTFATNRYALFSNAPVATARFAENRQPSTGETALTFDAWKAMGFDTDSTLTATASGVAALTGAPLLLSNGGFESGATGWSWWHAADPLVLTSGCATSSCLAVRSDGVLTDGDRHYFLLTSAPQAVSLKRGQGYLVTFDARSTNTGDRATLNLTRNGCDPAYPANCYYPVSAYRDVSLSASAWTHYAVYLVAKQDITNDGRLDFNFHSNGVVAIDNVQWVAAAPMSGNAEPVALYNTGKTDQPFACPAKDTTLCNSYFDVATGAAVSFPLTVAPGKGRIVASNAQIWQDADNDGVPGDGVAGGLDKGPGTKGTPIDADGRAIAP